MPHASGSYSTSGEATELSEIKSINIKGIGTINLPISESDAEKLMLVATYSQNSEILSNDNTYQDIFQLDASLIEITNQQNWRIQMQNLLSRVKSELGCKGSFKIKFHTLNLYKMNSHIKKHREKIPHKRVFAKIVVQLPSVYTGGDLIVYNPDGSKTTHDFGKSKKRTELALHYATYYTGAEHEMLAVSSGYRLALIYSLYSSDGDQFTTMRDDGDIVKCREILNGLKSSMNTIGIMLEQKYTLALFNENGVEALKGVDYDRYVFLRNSNYHLPFDEQFEFNIAHVCLESTEYREKASQGVLVWNESGVKVIFKADGDLLAEFGDDEGFKLDAFSYVIKPKILKMLVEEDFKDWKSFGVNDMVIKRLNNNGNNGCVHKRTFYNSYMLIMVPKKFMFEFYLKTNLNLAVGYIEQSKNLAKEEKIKLYKQVVERWNSKNLLKEYANQVLLSSKELDAADLAIDFLSKFSKLSESFLATIGIIFGAFGWDKVYAAVSRHFNIKSSLELKNSLKLTQVN